MAHGRKTSLTIELTLEERQTLLAWQRSTTMPAGRARRGRAILLLADGVPIARIADIVGLNRRFIYKWAKRFLRARMAGLTDLPGRGTGRHAARATGTAVLLQHGWYTAGEMVYGYKFDIGFTRARSTAYRNGMWYYAGLHPPEFLPFYHAHYPCAPYIRGARGARCDGHAGVLGLVSICIGYGNSNSPGLVSLPGARAPECLTQACRSAHSTIILQSFCNHSAIIV